MLLWTAIDVYIGIVLLYGCDITPILFHLGTGGQVRLQCTHRFVPGVRVEHTFVPVCGVLGLGGLDLGLVHALVDPVVATEFSKDRSWGQQKKLTAGTTTGLLFFFAEMT